jgi:hypothetical protein
MEVSYSQEDKMRAKRKVAIDQKEEISAENWPTPEVLKLVSKSQSMIVI